MNLISPINTLGYGIVGLNVALGLERAGLEPALWPIGKVEASPEHRAALSRMMGRRQTYDRRRPSLKIWHLHELAQHVGKGPHCAYAFFELDRLKPNELHHLASQDVIFAPSHWAREVLKTNGISAAMIRVARPGVDLGVFSFVETGNRQSGGFSLLTATSTMGLARPATGTEPTVFLNVGKWEVRKGHDILVEAFARAFSPSDHARLVMSCYNPCLPPHEEQQYNERFIKLYRDRLGERVRIVEERLPSQAAVAALMQSADCGVFPSRGEGWNLEALEMMALGKTVILTDYSAHTEYATQDNSRLIKIDTTEPARDGAWFNDDSKTWGGREPGCWAHLGESQIEQLIEHMRSVHYARQAGQLAVNRAGIETARRLTWDNTVADLVRGVGV